MNPDTEKLELLSKDDFETTLFAQSACNLSGIVYRFASILPKIWNEARARGKGTDWVNKHPVCALMAEQISHLAGCGMTSNKKYNAHDKYCRAMEDGLFEKAAEIFPEYAPLIKENMNG
jgi:hypothetical protein